MLNKPKFMSPSTNLQECTIDLKAGNVLFSCTVDGNETIHAWQIKVNKLNEANTLVFDTGKQLCEAFSPIDENNESVPFEIDIKKYMNETYLKKDKDNNTLFINSQEPYCWTISFWNLSDKNNDTPTVQSVEEVFYANSLPRTTIKYGKEKGSYSNLSNNLIFDSRTCYFKASYEQDEGIPLKRYGWRLVDTGNNQVLIDTISKHQIYGIADNIVCSYNGLLNGERYSVEVYIETQNNAVIISDPLMFTIAYDEVFLTSDFKVTAYNQQSAIALSWKDSNVIDGHAVGEIFYRDNYPIVEPDIYGTSATSVVIPDGSKIVYDYGSSSSLDIPEDSYIVLSTQLIKNQNAVLFSAEGTDEDGRPIYRKLEYTDTNKTFTYSIQSGDGSHITRTYESNNIPNSYVWYTIIMSPYLGSNGNDTTLKITESVAREGLCPSVTLKPSETLCPSFGTWDKLKGD